MVSLSRPLQSWSLSISWAFQWKANSLGRLSHSVCGLVGMCIRWHRVERRIYPHTYKIQMERNEKSQEKLPARRYIELLDLTSNACHLFAHSSLMCSDPNPLSSKPWISQRFWTPMVKSLVLPSGKMSHNLTARWPSLSLSISNASKLNWENPNISNGLVTGSARLQVIWGWLKNLCSVVDVAIT